ncbi:biotin--[acetyl-CoA-carboxylase] ligase [Clostridium fermenticellae]|uniref:Bifunctional ligase/repressor BirA n=1 Tax=Clostridium fermenticellae TaxID=2068654 RepID=A0A386H446_9CLOT|nr:biotin--[acetyl-CoA-carboxylase] ligase [Clostridium fermenticellae]AYD40511.1 biotin--[acetyl-CoA-carboxylase] ligase [Clostridium fermenticellae]
MKDKILHLLKKNGDGFISGQFISEKLGVTRAAVWKYINILKSEGYLIESVSRKGYKLKVCPDILNKEEIDPKLNTGFIGRNIVYFDSIDSTNTKAKELALNGASDGTLVISEEQTMGRGRLGRTWTCLPKYKGIFMSVILRPELEPAEVPKITQIGAAALVLAFKSLKIDTYIKWPNDIILNNKKLCGVLTEMSGELNKINYVVMGIGINANISYYEFPEEIRSKATSLLIETNKEIVRKDLVACVLNNFEKMYSKFILNGDISEALDVCMKSSILIGKKVRIINAKHERIGEVLGLDKGGELIVKMEDGNVEKIVSGEISIRGLNGYVS